MKFFLVLTFVASALAMPDEAQDTILDVNDNTGENAEFSQVNDDSKEVENIPVDATATKSLCSIDMVALNAVINKAIHAKLANEPVTRAVALEMLPNGILRIRRFNGATMIPSTIVETINIGTGGGAVTGKVLAYRPKYNDYHKSYLAGLFVNLEKLFPCIASSSYAPVCSRFTYEEDGFFKGKSILQASDGGNNFKVFGNNIATYGMAISGCPVINRKNGCLPAYAQTTITCLLPRSCK